jgi:DNA-binding CsgD family transcriptional regulator
MLKMDNWNAGKVRGLISAVNGTVREYAPSHTQSEGWNQFIQALDGIGNMLAEARHHSDLSSAKYVEKAEQIVWLSNRLLAIMTKRYLPIPTPLARLHPSLSIREIEVLRWSAEGKTAADIGVILNLKERTVHFHMSSAARKMGASNKTAAVAQAMMCGVL